MTYDPKTDTSKWPACSRKDCANMAKLRKWTLLRSEPLPSAFMPGALLKVNCVFKGNCQFGQNRMDLTQGDRDDD